ncbi:MAG: family 78 glycoside hydrolase catalytic domain [Clostridia bacterium]|nr:family 78 glycoside hydrolase catalytic domain [Clostridia bacterium]
MNNAKWITAPVDCGQAGVVFQKKINLKKAVKRATLNATAMGLYRAYIDGRDVTDALLMPGWTVYRKRVQYQSYDVTDMLRDGATLALECAQGWAVGRFNHRIHYSADRVSAAALLEVEYEDGSKEEILTDKTWQAYTSEVLFAEIYDGETQDRTAPPKPLGDAVEITVNTARVPQEGEWVKEAERFAPFRLIITPKGERVLDFGQNIAGYVEFKIKAKRGERIVISHAEVLDKDGNFYTGNYRSAKNLITYVCSGEEDVFKPRFSFQGFRYIRLDEYPDVPIDFDAIRAIAIHSEMTRTGHFVCGNEKINQLYHNIIWSNMNNYIDVPTDCPQRDERLGWTGDAQVFCRTAAMSFDVKRFFKKWLSDVALDQYEDGSVPPFVPLIGVDENMPISAAWADSACVCPWEIYLAYGDKALLAEHYPMMKRWVDYLRTAGPEEYLWLGGDHFGDWLALDDGEDSFVGATSNDLIATAYYARSTDLLVKAGKVLGEDMTAYEALYDKIVARFREYFMKDGMPLEKCPVVRDVVVGNPPRPNPFCGMTQTALVIILAYNLCEEKDRARIAEKLVDMIEERGYMTTGFIGTPHILHVLTENGYNDLAYRLLFREESPSWLYSVNHGATTIWEHWNSLKEDGGFWSTGMNSFNHYWCGVVYEWIFDTCVGIRLDESAPAYLHSEIAPHPNKNLGFADASIDTAYGTLRVKWKYRDGMIHYEITLPAGTTATLTLPSGYREELSGGTYFFTERE